MTAVRRRAGRVGADYTASKFTVQAFVHSGGGAGQWQPAILFILSRPRNVTIRDLVILPNSVDL